MNQDIIIPRPQEFEKKKKQFIKQSAEKIHVLSDFDKTLTKAFYQGEKIGSLISRLRNGNYLSEEYAQKAHALFDKYHPIEIDHLLSLDEKSKAMQEWWKAHMDLLVDSGITKDILKLCVAEMMKTKIPSLRDYAKEFLELLNLNKIPFIILSSSLQDLITEFLLQKRINFQNIHVVANSFVFDKKGKTVDSNQIIHVFNKNEATLEHISVYGEIKERKNIILLGDSLGDLKMVGGFKYDNLLKIAFLNDKVKENLELYKKQFDVIILNDGSFEFVNKLLREICD